MGYCIPPITIYNAINHGGVQFRRFARLGGAYSSQTIKSLTTTCCSHVGCPSPVLRPEGDRRGHLY